MPIVPAALRPRPHARRDNPARVFVLEDHDVVRRGIIEALDAAPDLRVVAHAATVSQARVALATAPADVAVIDIRLPDGNGLEYCRELHGHIPDLRVVIFSSIDDRVSRLAAAIAGARAYLPKTADARTLTATIHAVAAGTNLLAADIAAARAALCVDTLTADLGPLTTREGAVRDLLLIGRTNHEIAEILHLSDVNVRGDIAMILTKTLHHPGGSDTTHNNRRRRRRLTPAGR